MTSNRLSAREQRTIGIGVTVVAVALLLTYGVRPYLQRWQARASARAEAEQTVATLTTLRTDRSALETAADQAERALGTTPRRVLRARTMTLAASALQSQLQGAADASRVVITRVVVTPDSEPATTTGATGATGTDDDRPTRALPLQLSAYGDITGITQLLTVLSSGPTVILVDRVTLQRNSALAGAADVVQLTVTGRAPVWAMPDGADSVPTDVRPDRWRARRTDRALVPPRVIVDTLEARARVVVAGNPFSATRRAPRVPFVDPNQATVAPVAPMGLDSTLVASESYPRLSGIITVNGERQALLQFRADEGIPRLYRAGTVHAGYRLVTILRDSVLLSGPTGARRLGLATRPASDSREPLP